MPPTLSVPQMTARRWVVCGEALMDIFDAGDTATGIRLDARIGGSPLNVAVGLSRLGQPVSLFTGISTDFPGARLMKALQAEEVDLSLVRRMDEATTLVLVGLDDRGVARYIFHGHRSADRQLPPESVDRVPHAPLGLHFASYPMVVEPVASVHRALIERERGRTLISYDPNVRTGVEPDLSIWREAFEWCVRHADVLKLGEEDLHLLYPDCVPDELARRCLDMGCGLVVLTRGADGAQAWTARSSVKVPAPPCALIDTVGAGDSFQAAMLAWLAEHCAAAPDGVRLDATLFARLDAHALQSMLEMAARAASITCSRRGADLPRRSELFEDPRR